MAGHSNWPAGVVRFNGDDFEGGWLRIRLRSNLHHRDGDDGCTDDDQENEDSLHFRPLSVRCGLFDVVDDDDIYRFLTRFQLQSELFLKRREN